MSSLESSVIPPACSMIPHLSYATDLLFNLDEVRANSTSGLSTQNNLVTMLKGRISLERTYANELTKLANNSRLEESEHGTMREALGKLKAQYLNTSVQHRILANNLEEDVLKPIEALYAYNSQKANNLNKLINNIKKQAKIREDAYKKDYQSFDKNFREATMQFAVAMDAGFSSTAIERQYHYHLAELIQLEEDELEYESANKSGATSPVGSFFPTSPANLGRTRQKSVVGSSINNNSQKLVNWLLSSDQQRKDNLVMNAAKVLEVRSKKPTRI